MFGTVPLFWLFIIAPISMFIGIAILEYMKFSWQGYVASFLICFLSGVFFCWLVQVVEKKRKRKK